MTGPPRLAGPKPEFQDRRGASRIRHAEVVVNLASGSVAPNAPLVAEKIFAEFGVRANVCAPPPAELVDCLRKCIDAGPDLLVVLAGDGTARARRNCAGRRVRCWRRSRAAR